MRLNSRPTAVSDVRSLRFIFDLFARASSLHFWVPCRLPSEASSDITEQVLRLSCHLLQTPPSRACQLPARQCTGHVPFRFGRLAANCPQHYTESRLTHSRSSAIGTTRTPPQTPLAWY